MKFLVRIVFGGEETVEKVVVRPDHSTGMYYAYFERYEMGQRVWRQWGCGTESATLAALIADMQSVDEQATAEVVESWEEQCCFAQMPNNKYVA